MEGAATVPPRAAGQRIVLRRMAPARVAASAMLQRLRAAVAVGRPRNAFRDRAWRSLARAGHKARSTCRSADCDSISGQMVERIVAIGVTRVRFPADALFLAFARVFPFSWHHVKASTRVLPVPRSRGTLPRMHPRGRSEAPWRVSGSLQRLYSAKGADLAGSLPGIGSGWQQSKQDWGLPAVMGEHV